MLSLPLGPIPLAALHYSSPLAYLLSPRCRLKHNPYHRDAYSLGRRLVRLVQTHLVEAAMNQAEYNLGQMLGRPTLTRLGKMLVSLLQIPLVRVRFNLADCSLGLRLVSQLQLSLGQQAIVLLEDSHLALSQTPASLSGSLSTALMIHLGGRSLAKQLMRSRAPIAIPLVTSNSRQRHLEHLVPLVDHRMVSLPNLALAKAFKLQQYSNALLLQVVLLLLCRLRCKVRPYIATLFFYNCSAHACITHTFCIGRKKDNHVCGEADLVTDTLGSLTACVWFTQKVHSQCPKAIFKMLQTVRCSSKTPRQVSSNLHHRGLWMTLSSGKSLKTHHHTNYVTDDVALNFNDYADVSLFPMLLNWVGKSFLLVASTASFLWGCMSSTQQMGVRFISHCEHVHYCMYNSTNLLSESTVPVSAKMTKSCRLCADCCGSSATDHSSCKRQVLVDCNHSVDFQATAGEHAELCWVDGQEVTLTYWQIMLICRVYLCRKHLRFCLLA